MGHDVKQNCFTANVTPRTIILQSLKTIDLLQKKVNMKEIKSRWNKRDLAKKQRKARLARVRNVQCSASSDPDMYRGDRSWLCYF